MDGDFVSAHKTHTILELENGLADLRVRFKEMDKIISRARAQIANATHCLELAQRELSILSMPAAVQKSDPLEGKQLPPPHGVST